jgi:hypothetical protein
MSNFQRYLYLYPTQPYLLTAAERARETLVGFPRDDGFTLPTYAITCNAQSSTSRSYIPSFHGDGLNRLYVPFHMSVVSAKTYSFLALSSNFYLMNDVY